VDFGIGVGFFARNFPVIFEEIESKSGELLKKIPSSPNTENLPDPKKERN
jgi:hypothetical protein